jgi:hypothetical protein
MRLTLVGFGLAMAIVLTINVLMLALMGKDCDKNAFWILLNLPGLPCGIGFVILVPWEYGAFIVSIAGSCLFWGAVGAGIARLTASR